MKRPTASPRSLAWSIRQAEFLGHRSPLRSRAAQNRHCHRFLAHARRRGLLRPSDFLGD